MDSFETLRAFAVTVEEGSLAAAGRKLGRSPAAMTRAIAALEQEVGAAVFERTTRIVRLTEPGRRVLDIARAMLADFAALQQIGREAPSQPQGTITITAPLIAGIALLRPIVDDYLTQHPATAAHLLLHDRVVDLIDEGIDVALRIAHLPDSTLVAQRVGTVRTIVCASPAYLAGHETIQIPDDLAGHRIVTLAGTQQADHWAFANASRKRRIRVQPRLSVTSAEAALQSAIDGGGIARLLSYQVAGAIRDGRLKILLAGYELAPLPVHIVAPKARLAAAKTRAFFDFAAPRLRTAFADRELSADHRL